MRLVELQIGAWFHHIFLEFVHCGHDLCRAACLRDMTKLSSARLGFAPNLLSLLQLYVWKLRVGAQPCKGSQRQRRRGCIAAGVPVEA